MWVFGYGSLIWNPGFEYLDSKVGYIKGYVRRFWQGNDFHRGNKEKPGRVATLVEDNQGVTWGRAFLLGPAAEASLNYLDSRENKIGGYTTTVVTFHPRDSKDEPIPVLLYVALPSSHLYLGPAPLPQLATEISEASGHCGHNAEYLLRLANFMKEQLPDVYDEHIYLLDHLVRTRLKEQNLSVEDVMGEDRQWAIAAIAGGLTKDLDREVERPKTPPRSPDFASRVPSRKLRFILSFSSPGIPTLKALGELTAKLSIRRGPFSNSPFLVSLQTQMPESGTIVTTVFIETQHSSPKFAQCYLFRLFYGDERFYLRGILKCW